MAGATDLGTAQLLDQLAALVPVVAALAVQVGQLSQAGQAPGGAESAADGENAGAEQDLDGCRCGGSGRNDAEGDRAGESGHAGLTADLWAPGSSGEWAGPTAHDDDPVWR